VAMVDAWARVVLGAAVGEAWAAVGDARARVAAEEPRVVAEDLDGGLSPPSLSLTTHAGAK
jgi:hypothetical protein